MGYTGHTHGMTGTRFYRIWNKMQGRVCNKKHKYYGYYGGRGIEIEWPTFEAFMTDMYEPYLQHVKLHGEKKTSLDRIDTNGNYSKSNCQWATPFIQQQNRTDSVFLTYKGKTQTQAQWAKEKGINFATLRSRVWMGWSVERALTTINNKRL